MLKQYPSVLNIAIIGQGAIGLLWAHHLASQGHRITFVRRAGSTQPNHSQLVCNRGKESTRTFDTLNAQLPESLDLVIITTKAYQVLSALEPLIPCIKETPLLLLHNGMGPVEQLKLSQEHHIMLATTSHGALLESENSIRHTGIGLTMIGHFNGLDSQYTQHIATLLNNALPEVQFTESIERALWLKLAINCAINPLTALENCRNGDLAATRHEEIIENVCQEIALLTTCLGLDLGFEEIKATVYAVIDKTANNFSSMHQDIIKQRPTEIDCINGYVVSKAEQLGIKVPYNLELYQKIKRRETTCHCSIT
ncbi:2-dehydropantoate 2-reductase [Psychrobium sp. 1_MG-2023]|uniref:2-dehydropantoate 2-reductase n=1 Tax=Psychrobium sp. 1_MG-2023 TaxID=3062624 RepID=UPI000C3213E1|nr:2-dehydropantoate 2-reductase [Psychrobium sp. 1_MG-2023]MDP2560037.1 2-dehydropantoate 2-reductase [Psychrobium sp. 1_MG-2023]PKF56301.1 2-dehydropantoate 2-reductase [Alteromonadales bacterium alter-6D02]